MRKSFALLILLAILHIYVVHGENIQYAEIRLTILNNPPEINSITLMPEDPHFDSVIRCAVDVSDESEDTVKINYFWYVDGTYKENTNTGTLDGFEGGEEIICKVQAIDKEGASSKIHETSVSVLESPAYVKTIKPILRIAGIDATAAEIESGMSMSMVTGQVTGAREGPYKLSLIFMLSAFALVLVLLNLIIFALHISRKISSRRPRQG